MASIADRAVGIVRQLLVSGDTIFAFRGGLLVSSFPEFSEAFRRKLESYVRSGNRDDIEFVIRVMASYRAAAFLNETNKAVVRALPADDPLLKSVEVIPQSTWVMSDEFGFVEEVGNHRLAERQRRQRSGIC